MESVNMDTLRLYQAGVGIVARPHDPLIVTNSFLESASIVKEEWKLMNSQVSTRSRQSYSEYANGVVFVQNGDLLRIAENCSSHFKDDYEIFELADTFFEKTSGNIIGCGIDLDMWVLADDPTSWIADRLLKDDHSTFLQDVSELNTEFQFSMKGDFEGGDMQISLGIGTASTPYSGERSIVDIQGLVQFYSESPKKLQERVYMWKNIHECILEKLRHILEE